MVVTSFGDLMDSSTLFDTHPPARMGQFGKKYCLSGGKFGDPRGPPGTFGNQLDFANFTFWQ